MYRNQFLSISNHFSAKFQWYFQFIDCFVFVILLVSMNVSQKKHPQQQQPITTPKKSINNFQCGKILIFLIFINLFVKIHLPFVLMFPFIQKLLKLQLTQGGNFDYFAQFFLIICLAPFKSMIIKHNDDDDDNDNGKFKKKIVEKGDRQKFSLDLICYKVVRKKIQSIVSLFSLFQVYNDIDHYQSAAKKKHLATILILMSQ